MDGERRITPVERDQFLSKQGVSGWTLSSSLGKGQTIGKRITKIEVVDKTGKHISPGLSFLRSTILDLPFFLNGLMIPSSIVLSPLGYLMQFILFGFAGAIIYLYIFNRHTRQSLHDLACGTFVVKTLPKGEVAVAPVWKPHFVITGVWFLVVVAFLFVSQVLSQKGVLHEILALQNVLISSGSVHIATVSIGKTWQTSNGKRIETTHITSNAIWKKRPENNADAAKQIAALILKNYPDALNKDILAVTITYGYDIGIARAWRNETVQHSPREWQKILALEPAKR